MLFPREFVDRYGYPIPRSVRIAATGDRIADPNPDRYLLYIGASFAAWTYRPVAQGIGTVDGVVAPASSPEIYTHTLHGSLVNLGWEVLMPPAGPLDLLVIEAFMRDTTTIVVPATIVDVIPPGLRGKVKPWRTKQGLTPRWNGTR